MALVDLQRRRAEERRARTTLREGRTQPDEVDLDPIGGGPAVSLVHRPTLESWSLSGLSQPHYARATMPVRFGLRQPP